MQADTLSSLSQLLARAHSETLAFPTNVNTALRLQQELGNPDCHAADIHRLLLSEPGLSARAVSLANSVMFAHGHTPTVTSVVRRGRAVLVVSGVIMNAGRKMMS